MRFKVRSEEETVRRMARIAGARYSWEKLKLPGQPPRLSISNEAPEEFYDGILVGIATMTDAFQAAIREKQVDSVSRAEHFLTDIGRLIAGDAANMLVQIWDAGDRKRAGDEVR